MASAASGWAGYSPHAITGNLAILASDVVTGRAGPLSQIFSAPIFIAAPALTRLTAAGLEESGHGSLRPLLALDFILLTSFLAICVSAGLGLDSTSSDRGCCWHAPGSPRWRGRNPFERIGSPIRFDRLLGRAGESILRKSCCSFCAVSLLSFISETALSGRWTDKV